MAFFENETFNYNICVYCWLAGVRKYQLDWLYSILDVATRLIFGYSRYDHITSTFARPTTLAAGQSAYLFQAMFDGLQSAAWSRSRLHLGLLCQSLDKPAAIESTFCKSQLSGCAASVKDYQVWRTFVRNLRPHYVELAARLHKRRRLNRRVQVETKTYVFGLSHGQTEFFNLPFKYSLGLQTVRAYGAI